MDVPTSLEPLPGGWSGQTFLGEVAGVRSVVRVYAVPSDRGAAAHEVDAALLALVHGLLPVPRVLEVRAATADTPALLVTEHLPGERGDLLLPRLDAGDAHRLGRRLGRLAALLAGIPMSRRGLLVDAALTVRPFGDGDTVVGIVDARAGSVPGWGAAERTGLREVAAYAEGVLDTEPRASLVHSDLNPKNVLVDPATLEVTGLVDWEYAHAGHPWTDLGNLLRFERGASGSPYADGVRESYAGLRDTDPDRDLELARCADLPALVDLATRVGSNPVADAAHALLTAIARTGDVHAVG